MDLEVFLQNADSNLINIYESLVQAFSNIEPGVILEILTYSSPEQVVEKLIILGENEKENIDVNEGENEVDDAILVCDDDDINDYPNPYGDERFNIENLENDNITNKLLTTVNNFKNGISNLLFRNQSNKDEEYEIELSEYEK